jgi:ATP adenylyltransferase
MDGKQQGAPPRSGAAKDAMTQYEQIWAPWRLQYVQGGKEEAAAQPMHFLEGADPKCFLCQAAVAGEDRQRGVLWRTPHCLVVLNRFPYNNGHLLVAPLGHFARPAEIDAAVHHEMTDAINRMVAALERTLRPHGFNVGLNLGQAAGAGLPGHMHWHIVPRWNGDTNFMPVVGGLHVIPQSLDAVWEMLTAELGERS